MRIIDRDIEFWENEVQQCQWSLTRCYPACEPYWKERKAAAEVIVKSLQEYEKILRKAP